MFLTNPLQQTIVSRDLSSLQVTNQMITTCKHYINRGAPRIWDQDRAEVLIKIEDCQMLNREYQNAFHKIKEKLKV